MTKDQAHKILDDQKHGLHRYSKHLIIQALRLTGDLSGRVTTIVETDADQGVERMGLGFRKEFEQERHIGAVRRDRSRTIYLV
jgi:hypothetical protein